ncbi:DUF2267 domain-containing protein [Glycocaulis profundi]|nr:DUF2267 domain-containing protein [Glycocaulis profundi]
MPPETPPMIMPPVVLRDAMSESCDLLDDIRATLDLQDRMHAYAALRVLLHALRDRMAAETVLATAAGMPLMVSGIAVQGWTPRAPAPRRPLMDDISDGLPLGFPVPPGPAAAAVMAALLARAAPQAAARLRVAAPDLSPAPN